MRINRNHSNSQPGYPRTKQRQLLLDVIRQCDGHLDAKSLVKLAADRDNSISPATVYRNLNLFKKLGIIDEQHLGGGHCYYEIKRAPHHQHLVCSACGKVVDFECPLSEVVDRVKREQGFTVTRAAVQLEGYCAECAANKKESD